MMGLVFAFAGESANVQLFGTRPRSGTTGFGQSYAPDWAHHAWVQMSASRLAHRSFRTRGGWLHSALRIGCCAALNRLLWARSGPTRQSSQAV